jgi:hypothetical protein
MSTEPQRTCPSCGNEFNGLASGPRTGARGKGVSQPQASLRIENCFWEKHGVTGRGQRNAFL